MNLVCFDLDGVLVDSADWHYESFNVAMVEVVGVPLSREEHVTTFNGLNTLKKIDLLISQGRLPQGASDRLVKAKAKSFNDIIKAKLKPCPQKIELVEELKRQFLRVAVVSNCNRLNTNLLLGGLDLLDRVHYTVSSSDVVAGKPSPEGYYKAMLRLGVGPKETLIIEDSAVGVAAAKASGAEYVVVGGSSEVTWDLLRHRL